MPMKDRSEFSRVCSFCRNFAKLCGAPGSWGMFLIVTLGQGNVFTGVCLSTGCVSLYDATSCLADWSHVLSRGLLSLVQIFLPGGSLSKGSLSGGICPVTSGQYTSYWNAFLFFLLCHWYYLFKLYFLLRLHAQFSGTPHNFSKTSKALRSLNPSFIVLTFFRVYQALLSQCKSFTLLHGKL